MEERLKNIEEILLRIEQLLKGNKSPGRPIANPVDWKLAFEIWCERKKEYVTYQQLSNRFHVSFQTIQKICTGQSPAEKEYIKQTGDTELKDYLKWREKQYQT